MGAFQVEEAALLFCFVALIATILYGLIPDRRNSVEDTAKPARAYRPLWADRVAEDLGAATDTPPIEEPSPALAA